MTLVVVLHLGATPTHACTDAGPATGALRRSSATSRWCSRAARVDRLPRLALGARQGRPIGDALAPRRATSPSMARRWSSALMWVDSLKVGGIIISIGSPTDDRSEVERLAARCATPPPHLQRPGGRNPLPVLGRRDPVPDPDGHRRWRGGTGRLPDGTHHGARGAGRRDPPRVCAGGRCQQQSRQPDHQHPFLRW